MNDELKQIKKIYGEDMAHLCRELFPTILENEGMLLKILKDHLAPTKSFASDIRENDLYDGFKNWIYYYYDGRKQELVDTDKTPFELMDEAGYTLYECHSEEEIQSFRKYYAINELLCTITVGGRLNRCHVFFAIKKNVDEIKRENFANPNREDEYGRSVISIQFSRGSTNTLSIKNRYNHTVSNPDATFYNNLEEIIPGLTKSFKKYYGLNINQAIGDASEFLEYNLRYVRDNTGKYYRYNLESNGNDYCENNVIIADGKVISKYVDNKERYIIVEDYIIDRHKKKVYAYSEDYTKDNAFVDSINSVGTIKNIDVIRKGDNRVIIIKYLDDKEVKIEINKNNVIIGYVNDYVTEIDYYFLHRSVELSYISLKNVRTIDSNFLYWNNKLKSLSLENVITIGPYCLSDNRIIESVSLDKVVDIGIGFLGSNTSLRKLYLPELLEMPEEFLYLNADLEEIYVPKVKRINRYVLENNQKLRKISIPNAVYIGPYFLNLNTILQHIYAPNVLDVGCFVLNCNKEMQEYLMKQIEANRRKKSKKMNYL